MRCINLISKITIKLHMINKKDPLILSIKSIQLLKILTTKYNNKIIIHQINHSLNLNNFYLKDNKIRIKFNNSYKMKIRLK